MNKGNDLTENEPRKDCLNCFFSGYDNVDYPCGICVNFSHWKPTYFHTSHPLSEKKPKQKTML